MQNFLNEYGVSTGLAALIAALFNLLLKAWIDSETKKDIQGLRSAHEREIEQVRKENSEALQAQRVLLERLSYKQSKAHDMRLGAMQEIMTCIGNLELALNPLMAPRRVGSDEQKNEEAWRQLVKEAADTYNTFMETIMRKSWCLPSATAAKLEDLRQAAVSGLSSIEFAKGSSASDPKYGIQLFKKADEAVKKQVPAVKAQLEKDFRDILSAE
jgi:hypothetical protein